MRENSVPEFSLGELPGVNPDNSRGASLRRSPYCAIEAADTAGIDLPCMRENSIPESSRCDLPGMDPADSRGASRRRRPYCGQIQCGQVPC